MKIKEIAFVCCAVSDMKRARVFTKAYWDCNQTRLSVRIRIASSTTSGLERSQSKGTRIGPFLLMACQLHLKSTTSNELSDTCANTMLHSSSDRLKRRFVIGRRFAIPTGIGSSFTNESDRVAFIPFLTFELIE